MDDLAEKPVPVPAAVVSKMNCISTKTYLNE